MKASDNELLEKISERDQAAFTAFYNRYRNLMYRQIDSRIADKDAADDLFQEFWISVWDKPATIRIAEDGTAKKSLCFILSYRIIAYFRSAHDALLRLDSAAGHSAAEPSYSHVNEDLLAKEIGDMVERVVAKMPEIEQKIYGLYRQEDWRLDDIAAHLSLSKKTISNKLSLISGKLRTELSPLYTLAGVVSIAAGWLSQLFR